MKKSPLSTPGGHPGNFHRGRGRRRGYGYNQTRSDGDNFHRFSGSSDSQSSPFENNMIPLESSSPIYHNNRGNRRQPYDKRNQRFSNTGVSGSYNNQRNVNFTSQGSPFKRNQQQNNFHKKSDVPWHRKLPIAEFIDLKSIFDDPWKDLGKNFVNSSSKKIHTIILNDSSVEIISEKNGIHDSSSGSTSDENTINISSSLDEVKEGSSVDLQLDSMNFSRDSKDTLSSSNASQTEKSRTELNNETLNDSVIEVTH